MKKYAVTFLLFVALVSCKKEKFAPKGPTDIRVLNVTEYTMSEIIVNTSKDADTLGTVPSGAYSDYFRFEEAFPKADISAVINGKKFSTDSVDYTGMTYIGQAKITYELVVESMNDRKLRITNCSLDAPLD
jgi:hypothetical protein